MFFDRRTAVDHRCRAQPAFSERSGFRTSLAGRHVPPLLAEPRVAPIHCVCPWLPLPTYPGGGFAAAPGMMARGASVMPLTGVPRPVCVGADEGTVERSICASITAHNMHPLVRERLASLLSYCQSMYAH